jgi:hypothetical protein
MESADNLDLWENACLSQQHPSFEMCRSKTLQDSYTGRAQVLTNLTNRIASEVIDWLDVVIIYTCGLINMGSYGPVNGKLVLREAALKALSFRLNVSRETVRRRLSQLTSRHFVERYQSGYVVSNWALWEEISRAFADSTSEPKVPVGASPSQVREAQ